MDMHNIPVPLYFKAEKYHRQSKLEIDDFSKLPRPFYTICRIHDGTLFMDGKTGTLRLKSGDMFLLPMGETYVAQWRGNPGAVFSSIHFTFAPQNDPLRFRTYPLQQIDCRSTCKENIEDLFSGIIQHCTKNGFEVFDAIAKFYALCHAVFTAADFEMARPIDESVRAAVTYIEQNFNHPISVGMLAKLCNFSESRFYYLFKHNMGMPPMEYKNKIAVRRSMQYLIENPAVTIEEVSAKCGFCNSSYFRKVFFHVTGTTPSACRRLSWD